VFVFMHSRCLWRSPSERGFPPSDDVVVGVVGVFFFFFFFFFCCCFSLFDFDC
jgi:hypothetical protein